MLLINHTYKYDGVFAARQQGAALLIVLWMSVLLTTLIAGFAYNSQVEGLLGRRAVDRLQGIEAARAGLELAVYQLKYAQPEQQLFADGRPYELEFNGVRLTIRVQDESGKISLNHAQTKQLTDLLVSTDLDKEKAVEIADAILDFRDRDDLQRLHGAERADYIAAGLASGPKNNDFIATGELLQVYGMNYELYQKIAPALSVYSTLTEPDWRLAPKAVIATADNMTSEFIDEFMQSRFTQTFPEERLPVWPDGKELSVYAGNGPWYTVNIKAILANQSVTYLQAVINVQTERFFDIKQWSEYEG